MEYFVGILLVLWVVYMLGMFIAMRISLWREKHRPRKPWDKNREPRLEEFTADIDFWGKTAQEKYTQAHQEWNEREIRLVVYELPLEVVLKRDDLGGRYKREILRRNRQHIREDNSNTLGVDYSPRCQVCGSFQANARNEFHITLCYDCYTRLMADRRADSGYKLPSGATGFSAELWILHMIVALDLETGVIDAAQAQRELQIIVELERRRIKREEQRQQREAEKERAAEQRSINLDNAAQRLH